MPPAPVRVLFVCLGNICRSPMAEAVFRHLARPPGAAADGPGAEFVADSAGTRPYEVGGPAHLGTLAVLRRRGIDASGLVCRGVEAADFHRFDRILAVDRKNLDLLQRIGSGPARVDLLLPYGTSGELDLRDPFLDGAFDEVFALVDDACRGLLADLRGTPPRAR